MSRCPTPQNCECPEGADINDLKCGPCRKCLRRAELMMCGLRSECNEQSRDDSESAAISSHKNGEVIRVVRRKAPVSWCEGVSPKGMQNAQSLDVDLKTVMNWLETNSRPSSKEMEGKSPEARHYWLHWSLLALRDGVLYRKFHRKDNTGEHWQLIVPSVHKTQVLRQMHDGLLSGHLGRRKTREKVLQRYYWYGVRSDVDLWVARCDACESIKPPGRPTKAPMGRMPVGSVMDRLGTDILGPLPETPRGNKYILVVTYYFSKWVEIFAVPDQTAVTCAERILNEVVSRFGTPLSIHSDQGRNYESRIFMELCRLLEVRKTRMSPGNPRCNGLTERFNKTLVRMIKAYLKGEQTDWDRHLGCLAYRATVQESTGLTPNLIMLGREVRLPAEVMFGTANSEFEINSYGEYVENLRLKMRHAHDVARKHLEVAAQRQKECHDANVHLERYKSGDLVWYQTEMSQLHVTPKLRRHFEGPHIVLDRFSELVYLIQLNKKGNRKVVHHNRLRPYRGLTTLPWAKAALNKYHKLSKK